jgi:hypothetical protein
MSEKCVTVIYIAGLGRSGSTLLAELLSARPGVLSAGELPKIWHHGWRDDWCSADGHQFSTSPVWRRVLQRLRKLDPSFEEEEAFKLSDRILTQRNWRPFWFFLGFSDARARVYQMQFDLLYRALSEVTRNPVIVDSGKLPYHAALMARSKAVKLKVVHLVRDPRAVAYSKQRKKINLNLRSDYNPTMRREYALRVSLRWVWHNFLVRLVCLRCGDAVLVRYEDLVQDPHPVLEKILGSSGLESLGVSSPSSAQANNIAFTGNSRRFGPNSLRIKPDFEWKLKLPLFQLALISLLTLPVRLWFGYGGVFGSKTGRKAS